MHSVNPHPLSRLNFRRNETNEIGQGQGSKTSLVVETNSVYSTRQKNYLYSRNKNASPEPCTSTRYDRSKRNLNGNHNAVQKGTNLESESNNSIWTTRNEGNSFVLNACLS